MKMDWSMKEIQELLEAAVAIQGCLLAVGLVIVYKLPGKGKK
jgi:hypothetical protein